MFKINDKTRRQAYLNALSQTQDDMRQLEKTKNEKNSNEQITNSAKKRRAIVIRRNGRKFASNIKAEREVLTGKEAITAAAKDIKVLGSSNPHAIINKHIADMKYYEDWRERLNSVESQMRKQAEIEKKQADNAEKPGSKFAGFDEIDRELGDVVQAGRNESSSKGLLDDLFPKDTKNDGADDFSFLDDLFSDIPDKKFTSEDKPGTDSFVDGIKTGTKVQTQPKVSRKIPIKKKKRKIDADIIGTTGFFTIR